MSTMYWYPDRSAAWMQKQNKEHKTIFAVLSVDVFLCYEEIKKSYFAGADFTGSITWMTRS